MHRMLAALLPAVLALSAVLTMRASAQAPGYRLYTNPRGYQIEIPADWLEDPSPAPPIDAHFSSTDQQAGIVLQAVSGAPALDVQQTILDLDAVLAQQHPGFNAGPPQSDSLEGADNAALGGGAWMDGGTLWTQYVIVAARGGTLYQMRLAVTWDYHLAHGEQLEHVLESFQLTDPAAIP